MNDCITLAHGEGGRLYRELVEQVFLPAFDNVALNELGDSAVCPAFGDRLALTTDSFVVRPRFSRGATSAVWRSAAPSTIWLSAARSRCT